MNFKNEEEKQSLSPTIVEFDSKIPKNLINGSAINKCNADKPPKLKIFIGYDPREDIAY